MEIKMTTQKTVIEQMAIGHATSQIISCDNNFQGTWFEKFQYINENLSNRDELDGWVAWQPFENLDWPDIIANIQKEAESLTGLMTELLENAKHGLIFTALFAEKDCSIDSGFEELDMGLMVETGFNVTA